jgi:basic membrane protein A
MRFRSVLVTVLAALVLASCGDGGNDQASGEDDGALKVAMIFAGKVDDESFNQTGFEGLKRVEREIGAEISFTEAVPAAEAAEAFRDFAAQGNDVVIAHGGEFEDAALRVAEEFPDVRFAVINGNQGNGSNYAGYRAAAEQWKFLAGALAGIVTESDKVGYIAGICFPAVAVWANGARDGVQLVNPEAEFIVTYTQDFADSARAQEAAIAMEGQGVDVVLTTLDEGVLGVLEAAQGSDLKIIPEWFDYTQRAPESALASSLMPFDDLPMRIVQDVTEGTFSGEVFELTMQETADSDALTPLSEDLVPAGTADRVEEIRQQLVDGEIVVEPDPQC